MIQARDNLVWVRNDAGELEPFAEDRLAAAVQRVTGADEDGRAVAETVAGAVFQYARDHAAERIVTTVEIAEMVEAVLLILGYDEATGGGEEIRLDVLAARTGVGFELAFYRELGAALGRAQQRRAVRVSGLRACVLRLRGARRWGAGCRQLAQEILEFVYARAARARALQLAVVE